MKRWLVKVWHYGGGTSVITDYESKDNAQLYADTMNGVYQTDTYYVEENDRYKSVTD